MFCQRVSSHLQEAANAACLCRSVDVTDMYRHVHSLWSESIAQPKSWVRFPDSTCNSTKDHSKKQRHKDEVGGAGFFHMFLLSIPPKYHTFNSLLSKSPFPGAQPQKTAHSGMELRNHSPRAVNFCPSFRFKPISYIDF